MQARNCGVWTPAGLTGMPWTCHSYGMQKTLQLDGSNRIVLSRDVRRAAGIQPGQTLKVLVSPGRIVLELEPDHSGRVVKRGKLKVWTGDVAPTPLSEAVEQTRRYER